MTFIKKILVTLLAISFSLFSGCSEQPANHAKGVYMLMDTSGTYTQELKQAQKVINFILSNLNPGDTFAVARVDTGSFSEKDIVAKVTFEDRPSMANQQKRVFREKIDTFIKGVKGSRYTDISGGVLQAIEFLTEANAGNNLILIFSDLKEDLPEGYTRDIPLQLNKMSVVALNVTKLRSDNIDPREYMDRLSDWENRVQSGGGNWKVINDLERLESIMQF
ncbi:MAG: VWA domain-containing protein [Gammaproteobacteria bacterium]|nr:VWA domain-containing protein [Gammaproteobacteria bacterium]